MTRFAITVLGFVLMSGCGSSPAPVGTSRPEANPRALEMAFRTPLGEWIHVGDLRGQPVLIFAFATFDGVSQAALRPLSRFVRRFGDVAVLGVAAQPDARQLLDPYERALRPPFPLVYDPERNVHQGTSPLGAIQSVPTFIMYDAYGMEVSRHVGFPNTHTLERMRDDAIERGGIGEGDAPPLLGTSSP